MFESLKKTIFIRFRKPLLSTVILNIILIIWYFIILTLINIPLDGSVMFSTYDSQTYLEVAHWIETGNWSMFVEHRPILYPLFLVITNNLGGVGMIWIIQFVFWCISANLIFATIKKLTRSSAFSIFGFVLFVTNISLIALTRHALTEVLNIFLLTLLIWIFVKHFKNRKEPKFIISILFLLGLLTINKPVFSIPLWVLLFGFLPVFYWRIFLKKARYLLLLLLALTPVIIQLGIMKSNFDTWGISNISGRTFENYLLADGVQKIDAVDRETAIERTTSMRKEEQKKILFDNLSVFGGIFFQNLETNLKEESTFLRFPKDTGNHFFLKRMESLNLIYWYIHLIFFPLSIILMLLHTLKKQWGQLLITASVVGLGFYYILATGISHSQGDRLVLGALPLWIVGYLYVVHSIYTRLKERKTSTHSKSA